MSMFGLEGRGLRGGGVGGSYQPGVYVPLKALFLVFRCSGTLLLLGFEKSLLIMFASLMHVLLKFCNIFFISIFKSFLKILETKIML